MFRDRDHYQKVGSEFDERWKASNWCLSIKLARSCTGLGFPKGEAIPELFDFGARPKPSGTRRPSEGDHRKISALQIIEHTDPPLSIDSPLLSDLAASSPPDRAAESTLLYGKRKGRLNGHRSFTVRWLAFLFSYCRRRLLSCLRCFALLIDRRCGPHRSLRSRSKGRRYGSTGARIGGCNERVRRLDKEK